MRERTCGGCAHWNCTSAAKAFGECRRYPAAPLTYTDEDGDTVLAGNKWPLVGAEQWCGEWAARN